MRPWINQRDGLGGGLPQNQNEFVQVFGMAAQGCQLHLGWKQSGQGAVVAVQIKSLLKTPAAWNQWLNFSSNDYFKEESMKPAKS